MIELKELIDGMYAIVEMAHIAGRKE